MERFGYNSEEFYLKRGFSIPEIRTAMREGVTIEWLRHILDTYMDECAKAAKERRDNRMADNG